MDNFLVEYDPAEIVALLSCFVFQEKSQSVPSLTPKLQKVLFVVLLVYFGSIYCCKLALIRFALQGIDEIKKIALRVHEVQKSCGLNVGGEQEGLEGLKVCIVLKTLHATFFFLQKPCCIK